MEEDWLQRRGGKKKKGSGVHQLEFYYKVLSMPPCSPWRSSKDCTTVEMYEGLCLAIKVSVPMQAMRLTLDTVGDAVRDSRDPMAVPASSLKSETLRS